MVLKDGDRLCQVARKLGDLSSFPCLCFTDRIVLALYRLVVHVASIADVRILADSIVTLA